MKKKFVIGINEGMNSSVVLQEDSEIIFAAQEERFNKIKEFRGFPEKALRYTLKKFSISKDDISCICLSNLQSPKFNNTEFINNYHFNSTSWIEDFVKFNLKNVIKKIVIKFKNSFVKFFKLRKFKSFLLNFLKDRDFHDIFYELGLENVEIKRTHHHLNHAASVYFGCRVNRNDKYLVLTLDGGGDQDCSHVYEVAEGNFRLLAKTQVGHSIGNIYSRITYLLGMLPHSHEYKIMGLAPYANTKYSKEISKIFFSYLDLDKKNTLKFKKKIKENTSEIIPRLAKDLKFQRFDNISGGIQMYCEELIVKWIKECIKKTNIKKVLCAGGVFMNIKVNKVISEIDELEHFDVFPSCGDETLPFGSIWLNNKKETQINGVNKLNTLYLGNETNFNLVEAEKKYKEELNFEYFENINDKIASLIADKEIVSRCSGKMEFGARALGNRSILASPSDFKIVAKINKMIKKRDFWMPFSPMMTLEQSKKILEIPKSLPKDNFSPWMMHSFDCKINFRDSIPAALHPYDSTTRAQIVTRDTNNQIYELLKIVGKKTGIEVLLNTSFNLHGYPIVQDYKDAIYVLLNSGLNYLVIDNYLVSKKINNIH